MITPASVQDRDAAKGLIQLLVSMYGRLQIIWADGGYRGPQPGIGPEQEDSPGLARRRLARGCLLHREIRVEDTWIWNAVGLRPHRLSSRVARPSSPRLGVPLLVDAQEGPLTG